MLRRSHLILGTAVILASLGSTARAQFAGYGGWGGWGSTPGGDIGRGLGYYAEGAGDYNRNTAIANRINAQTIGQWNEFMFLSQMEANRRARARMDARMKRDARAGDQAYQRLKENPTPDDIGNGAALNVILDQLTDPRIQSSALRLANNPLSGSAVRRIPFTNAAEGVAISLSQLTNKDGWPLPLRDPRYAPERMAYQDAVNRALKESENGNIAPQTAQGVQAAARRLRAKLLAMPPTNAQERVEATNYVNRLLGMSRMLEQPRVDKILAELDSIKQTTLGSLLGFMHSFNLRFGPATTPEQRAVYEQLYPMLVSQRDRIMKEAGITENNAPRTSRGIPSDFFQGMHLDNEKADNPPSNNH